LHRFFFFFRIFYLFIFPPNYQTIAPSPPPKDSNGPSAVSSLDNDKVQDVLAWFEVSELVRERSLVREPSTEKGNNL